MNAKPTAREILDNMLNSGELSNTAWGLVSQNADDTMAEAARGLIEREPFEYMSETYCEIVLAHIAEYGNPTKVAETPAPLDCFSRPAAVVLVGGTIYVVDSVDEFGAIHVRETAVGRDVPAKVTGTYNPGAVPALDVAVYESGLWAFARKPQHVTVKGHDNITWHLTDADGQPVAAGEYTAKDGDRFTIAQHPDNLRDFDHPRTPLHVEISWTTINGEPYRNGHICFMATAELVPGWGWTPEQV